MSDIKNGGAAFPTYASDHRGAACNTTFEPKGGMTLRDYFAAMAVSGVWSRLSPSVPVDKAAGITAEFAYEIADAMLKERNK